MKTQIQIHTSKYKYKYTHENTNTNTQWPEVFPPPALMTLLYKASTYDQWREIKQIQIHTGKYKYAVAVSLPFSCSDEPSP